MSGWILKRIILTFLVFFGSIPPVRSEQTLRKCWNYKAPHIIYNISVSKDGRRISASSCDGSIYLFDENGAVLKMLDIGQDVTSLCISANGRYVVATVRDLLYLLDEELKLLGKYKMREWIEDISLSESGEFIVCACRDRCLYFLDNECQILWQYELSNLPRTVATDSQGKFVVVGGKAYIALLDNKGELLAKYETSDEVIDISLTDDGEYIIAASQNSLYSFSKDGELLWKETIEGRISRFSSTRDGRWVASGSVEGNVYLFNRTGELVWKYGLGNCVWGIGMTDDGKYLAVAPWDSYIYFWERETGKNLSSLQDTSLPPVQDSFSGGEPAEGKTSLAKVSGKSPKRFDTVRGLEKTASMGEAALGMSTMGRVFPAEEEIREKPAVEEDMKSLKGKYGLPQYQTFLTLLVFLGIVVPGLVIALVVYRKKYERLLRRYSRLLSYERASGLTPEDKDLAKMLARVYQEEEVFDAHSAPIYEKAEMFGEAGLSYQNGRNLTKAAEMYEKKASKEGDSYEVLSRLVQIYDELSRKDKLVNVLTRMVKVADNSSDLEILGQLLEKLDDTGGAILAFEKLTRLDARNPEYQERLLKLYFKSGNNERYLALAEEMRKKKELDHENLYQLARLYYDKGIFSKATEIYEELAEKTPEHRYELIRILLTQERIEEALHECAKLTFKNGQEVTMLIDLLVVLSEKYPGNVQVKNLIEEIYRKADSEGFSVDLAVSDFAREQMFRPPLVNPQEQYSVLKQQK